MVAEFRYAQDDSLTASPGTTPWQTVGPFFSHALPYSTGPAVAGPERAGALRLAGRVFDGQGAPVPDSLIEIWQADEHGDFARAPGIYEKVQGDRFRGFGRCASDEEGRYEFHTVKPGPVPTVDGRPQAPHIAMSVFARGMLRRAVTRVYFDDEADANAADPLLSFIEPRRRTALIARSEPGGYRFDVHIQGADETVFLDVATR